MHKFARFCLGNSFLDLKSESVDNISQAQSHLWKQKKNYQKQIPGSQDRKITSSHLSLTW